MLSRFLWSYEAPCYWFHMCFPHINITWARRTGILTTAQVYPVTCFHIFTLHFFVLSVWDDDVIHNRFTSGPSALVLPFLSSEVRACSAEKQSEREKKMFFGKASILWMHGSRYNLSSSLRAYSSRLFPTSAPGCGDSVPHCLWWFPKDYIINDEPPPHANHLPSWERNEKNPGLCLECVLRAASWDTLLTKGVIGAQRASLYLNCVMRTKGGGGAAAAAAKLGSSSSEEILRSGVTDAVVASPLTSLRSTIVVFKRTAASLAGRRIRTTAAASSSSS